MEEQRGLSKPMACPRCPMHYHDDTELLAHLKEKHGVENLVRTSMAIMEGKA